MKETRSSGSLLNSISRWHGGIDDQFTNIDNLVNCIMEHQPGWSVPPELLAEVTECRDQLRELIVRCRGSNASRTDRQLRNALLKSTVGFCLLQMKIWAYDEYEAGLLKPGDIHRLGFLLPGKVGRIKIYDARPEVRVSVVGKKTIRVIIEQAGDEPDEQVMHGWPHGLKNALVVVTADDEKTEVLHVITARLYNSIRLPGNSRGKRFFIKASFLKNEDDLPRFGRQRPFFIPLDDEDFAAAADRQYHEDFEAQLRETELQRQEIDRLNFELGNRNQFRS